MDSQQSYEQRDTCYRVETEVFDPGKGDGTEKRNREALQAFRWWPVLETVHSTGTFTPRDLGHLLETLVTRGPPAEPIETGY